jgi:signal transduction histidine kinase/ActR/RegA family two-component response regulator
MTSDEVTDDLSHCTEPQRLAALRRYDILDTPPEPSFDDITRLIAHVCETPMAMVTFVDAGRQWFKSEIGLGVRETPLDRSICAHAILQSDLFIVQDTLEDERFKDSPFTRDTPPLRFYAGARLQSPDGQALGTLCVLDFVPRTLTDPQQDALRALSRQVMTQLELRRALAAQLAAAAELEAARIAAEQASLMKDQFLATVSHELRTPLAAILLWAGNLRGGAAEAKLLDEGLATILASAKAQRKLIEDLLDVSRIAAGKLSLHLAEVDLLPLVREAVEAVLPAAREKSVAVETDLALAGAVAHADPDRLRQVVWNLLNNAVDFTPAGGTVRVGLRTSDGAAELRVCDTGRGIGPDFLPHVFEPFRQEADAATRPRGGLGLGLAIARKLVELHGGTIAAQSPGLGRGATFTVRLALTHASDAPPEVFSGAPAADESLGGVRILLVEDDPATRTGLVEALRQAGAEVTAVESAAAALGAFERRRPDVLLSDIGLPGTDGYELMRQVRRLQAPHGVRTPAAALTAYAGDDSHRRALSAGFDTHLPKPIDGDELVEVITRLAGREWRDV